MIFNYKRSLPPLGVYHLSDRDFSLWWSLAKVVLKAKISPPAARPRKQHDLEKLGGSAAMANRLRHICLQKIFDSHNKKAKRLLQIISLTIDDPLYNPRDSMEQHMPMEVELLRIVSYTTCPRIEINALASCEYCAWKNKLRAYGTNAKPLNLNTQI